MAQSKWKPYEPDGDFSGEVVAKLRRYGLSPAEYRMLNAAQDGLCAICRKPCTRRYTNRKTRLCVDHDHSTGRFRGLLCADCNNGLGYFHDDVDLLLAAASYLVQNGSRDYFDEPDFPCS